jgi:hypothetical protein
MRGNTRFISSVLLNKVQYLKSERMQRTSEMSCLTREINLVFPSIHVFFCLLHKGQSLESDNFYRKAIIFTCEIIIGLNNLTSDVR